MASPFRNDSWLRPVLGGLGLCWIGAVLALPDPEPLSAGLARWEITPDPKLTNWIGHKPYDGLLDPLFARALVLDQGTNRVALLCLDLVDVREGCVVAMRRAIFGKTGIPPAQVLVHASHTHSAPRSPSLGDPLLDAERGLLAPVLQDPLYQAWAERLVEAAAEVVRTADKNRRPASLAIARATVAEVLFNRRPRRPDGSVLTVFEPADPYVLPEGQRFGPLDPTLTLLMIRDAQGPLLASLFHLPCHPVAIYPYHKGLSADWPGAVSARLQAALGGEALFLQGCAGDIVPARRGLQARDQMAGLITERALAAAKVAFPVPAAPLQVQSTRVELPLTEAARRDLDRETLAAEVQVVVCGGVALVALPGEPLISLALAIQQRSPFPHTLVLGYSNGYGIQYVGMPGEKARGGYEMGDAGAGADACGQLLVDAAARLLERLGPSRRTPVPLHPPQ